MRLKIVKLFVLLCLITTLFGCTDKNKNGTNQMPNPASVYCEQQGYRLEIRNNPDGGQYGVCIFSNSSECEEWQYYRGECTPG